MTFTKMLKIIWCLSLLVLLDNFALKCAAHPATATEATNYIVSYVRQRNGQRKQQQAHESEMQHNDFDEFDFDNFRSNLTSLRVNSGIMGGAVQKFFGRFVESFGTNVAGTRTKQKNDAIFYNKISDDLMNDEKNTLESGFGDNEQHESVKNATMWQRSKQSIPVLESVRHLVNSVRDGHLNNTEHLQRNRTLLSEMQPMLEENTTSVAIETEKEREMTNHGTDLQFLEVLGSIGSRIWTFFSNIRQVFAASAGSASAASSSSSSSSSF